jgi:hydrogenase expression/formation protein HypE
MTALDLQGWTCPAPLRDRDNIVMGQGGGGRLTAELVEHLFVPAFGAAGPDGPDGPGDSAVLDVGGARLAFTTDSYVVQPLFFPGGSIGELAVNGTVNDLAMSGAVPLYLSCGFILEEGLALRTLQAIAAAMGVAALAAGVRLVTGDTKVVDTGNGDGLFVNTAGIGLVPAGLQLGAEHARPGDAVLVSGPIGLHGIAIMSVREGLEFGTVVESDTAALGGLVAAMIAAVPGAVHALRDPTRGGVAASLNELAAEGGFGVELVERDVPVPEAVAAGCGMLGLDPLYIANEGRLVLGPVASAPRVWRALAEVTPAETRQRVAWRKERKHRASRTSANGNTRSLHPTRRSRTGGLPREPSSSATEYEDMA